MNNASARRSRIAGKAPRARLVRGSGPDPRPRRGTGRSPPRPGRPRGSASASRTPAPGSRPRRTPSRPDAPGNPSPACRPKHPYPSTARPRARRRFVLVLRDSLRVPAAFRRPDGTKSGASRATKSARRHEDGADRRRTSTSPSRGTDGPAPRALGPVTLGRAWQRTGSVLRRARPTSAGVQTRTASLPGPARQNLYHGRRLLDQGQDQRPRVPGRRQSGCATGTTMFFKDAEQQREDPHPEATKCACATP